MRKVLAMFLIFILLMTQPVFAESDTAGEAAMYGAVTAMLEDSGWQYEPHDDELWVKIGFNLNSIFCRNGAWCYIFVLDESVHIQCDYDMEIPDESAETLDALIGKLNNLSYIGRFYRKEHTLGYDIVIYSYDSVPTTACLRHAMNIGVSMLDEVSDAFDAVINKGKSASEAYKLVEE